jgi:5-formyltetrahydrofolate cyclo-ligase
METEKRELRKKMSAMRNQLSREALERSSERLFERLSGDEIYQKAEVIYSYASFRSEVDTWHFNRKVLSDGKLLALPKVLSKERMEFYKVEAFEQLVQGYMGIWEPGPECPVISDSALENAQIPGLILVPGLAFDEAFHRLGYGGGYYDRYLSLLDQPGQSERVKSCGIALDCQFAEKVPCDSRDHLLDYIVTESRLMGRMGIV